MRAHSALTIWAGLSRAPDPKARTLPSQSLAIAFGHAVAEVSLPWTLPVIREVLSGLRHAGMRKKLTRMVGRTEAAAVTHPDMLFALTGGALPKGMKRVLARAVEALWQRAPLTHDAFTTHLMTRRETRQLAEALIWIDDSGQTALPRWRRGKLDWTGPDGAVVVMREPLALWHPSTATAALRTAWRDRIVSEGVTQPFAQAFREHYPPEADAFAGHHVAIGPLFALAIPGGWRHAGAFVRDIGPWRFSFDCGDIYPTSGGETLTGAVTVERRGKDGRLGPAVLDDPDPVLVSEVLRSIDLMVSVATRAVNDHADDVPTRSVDLRRDYLARVLPADSADVRLDRWHLVIGDVRLHLGTGRLTRKGDPLDLPEVAGKVHILPHADTVLRTAMAAIAAFGVSGR